MANPKTHPVNYLQEFSLMYGHVFPDFSDLGFEGQDHCRKFFYRCVFGKYEVIGSATTKKLAKHEAAIKMVNLLEKEKYLLEVEKKFSLRCKSNFNLQSSEYKVPAAFSLKRSLPIVKSPVSALQEYCQHNKLALPVYWECDSKQWFIVKCVVQAKQTLGEGLCKKEAKLNSASKMCKELNIPCADIELGESENSLSYGKPKSQDKVTICVADVLEDLSLETGTIPTLVNFCARNKQLPSPNFQLKNSFTKTFYEFECDVGSFVGRGVYETEEGAKTLAAKFVLSELLKAGYSEMDISELDFGSGSPAESVEDCNNNDSESLKEYCTESEDKTETRQFSLQYPISALKKLCGSHRSLPIPRYLMDSKKDASGNCVVICQVGSIREEGRDAIKRNAKVLAARKVIERLILEGFPRKDLHKVGSDEEEACYGDKYPMCALENLCSVYCLKSPSYRITERHKGCFVISCSVVNTVGEGRDVTKKGAKVLAAKSVLQQLLNMLNIGLTKDDRYLFDDKSSIVRENQPVQEDTGFNKRETNGQCKEWNPHQENWKRGTNQSIKQEQPANREKETRVQKRQENDCKEFKEFYENWKRETNQNIRQEHPANREKETRVQKKQENEFKGFCENWERETNQNLRQEHPANREKETTIHKKQENDCKEFKKFYDNRMGENYQNTKKDHLATNEEGTRVNRVTDYHPKDFKTICENGKREMNKNLPQERQVNMEAVTRYHHRINYQHNSGSYGVGRGRFNEKRFYTLNYPGWK